VKRRLLLLNFALLVLLGLTGWRIWQTWEQARAREGTVLGQAPEPVPAPPAPAVEVPEPVVAADYIDIAELLIFVSDRNPFIEIDVAPPKPLPPMPVAHGVLDLGSGPTAILSERAGDPQQGYRAGDYVGDLLLVGVTVRELIFEWEGEHVRRTVNELRPETEDQPRAATPSPTAPAVAKPKSTVLSASPASKARPSEIGMGGGDRACQQGDTSPPGTVTDGYRKVVTESPFGLSCRWVPIQ
jgi:hypothetical protein